MRCWRPSLPGILAFGAFCSIDPKENLRSRNGRSQALLSDAPVAESDQDKPGVILDYDGNSNVVGLEILEASKSIPIAMLVAYAIMPPL